MAKVVHSTILDAPPDAVWAVLADYDAWPRWHPAYADSAMERGARADCVGSVRRVRFSDGREFAEQLLTLSDLDLTIGTCLLETTIPLFNYVAHVRVGGVTDGMRTFLEFEGRFDAPPDKRAELERFVAEDLFEAGSIALRRHLGLEV